MEARVVAAVDFSDISPAVVRAACGLARKLGGPCLVVHAVEALTGEEEGHLIPSLRRWVEELRSECAGQLRQVIADAGLGSSGPVAAEVLTGRAATTIHERAERAGAGLVVLGGPPPSRLLGSTAERIVRRGSLPTLVIRRPPPAGYRSILAAVDFSDAAAQALLAAHDLAEPGFGLTACHVLDTHGFPGLDEALRAAETLEGRLAAWTGERCPGVPIRVRVEQGVPKHKLLEVAAEEGADLLVLGRKGKTRLGRLLLGSVAESAARRAPCDVLIVGGEAREAEAL